MALYSPPTLGRNDDPERPKEAMSYAEHFSIANIPFGIASGGSHAQPAPVTRLGDTVFFLADLDLPVDAATKQTFSQVSSALTPLNSG